MPATRPITPIAARIHCAGRAWTDPPYRTSDAHRQQVHGELQPMEEARPESWGKSLLCAVLVAVVLVAMVAAWGVFA